ncbi:MAG: AMP-binding protein, partial [bacterium]|nr:AMP-binding protein [bacterium]
MTTLARHKIEILYLPFSYLNFLFNQSTHWGANFKHSLKHIITAGEQLKITAGLRKFLEDNPQLQLHNHYGSSEMHVVASYTLDAANVDKEPVPPAGKPIANTRIFILDEKENPVPIGVWGELYVSGSTEVAGYINNESLSNQKLNEHPILPYGKRLYRSGDIGRQLPDGNICLKGRKDSQVKIRGFRVELSEIESKIVAINGVKDCVVVVKEKENGEKEPVAYVVLENTGIAGIKKIIRNYLPQYMIPRFIKLPALPLMPNGKVDREKLPEPVAICDALRKTAPRPSVTNLEHLPLPNRSLVDYEKYSKYIGIAPVKNTIALQTTRGCPYKCAYCHKIWPKTHVYRPSRHIFEEVHFHYQMGCRRFVILDDVFNLNRENSAAFFKLIIRHGLKIQIFFPNGLRGDTLTKEYIDLMIEAVTVHIGLSLETASPRLQKSLGKYLNLDKFRGNVEYLCEEHPGVFLELFTMHGLPGETEEEAMLTLNFIKSMKWVDFPYVHILKIWPNTDMEKLALENGITPEAIKRSANLAFHQIPETLPFDKSFTFNYQADFLDSYFMSKERLLNVLPHQMRLLSENEFVQKYDSYLPQKIDSFKDFLGYAGLSPDELEQKEFVTDDCFQVPGLNEKLKTHFDKTQPGQTGLKLTAKTETPLKVLLLDLSHYFGDETAKIYNVAEPPLGLMCLMSYLKENIKTPVKGKIAKAFIDFDSYEELETLVHDFKPGVIGIRTLTLYREFFHKAAAKIRQWSPGSVVIAGGPYATSDYETILKDRNIDLTVLGEGELTFLEVIEQIVENGGKLPDEEVLREIRGIAFIPPHMLLKDEVTFDHMETGTGTTPDTKNDTDAGKVNAAGGPGSHIGRTLAEIWAGVLEIEVTRITSDGNFFELGGHSLNATRMVANIHKELQVKIPLTTVFKNQTLNELTEALEGLTKNKYAAITPVEKKEYYPLSAAQKRLYILQQMDLQSTTYNMPGTIPLPAEVTVDKLEETIRTLIQRHESLRTSFHMIP